VEIVDRGVYQEVGDEVHGDDETSTVTEPSGREIVVGWASKNTNGYWLDA
jgi:hypothetical protein